MNESANITMNAFISYLCKDKMHYNVNSEYLYNAFISKILQKFLVNFSNEHIKINMFFIYKLNALYDLMNNAL